jgi:hypothetical protein
MRIPALTHIFSQSPVSIAAVPSHDSFMDIPSLEQELLNSAMAPASQIDQTYVDSYFTSSDSNEEQLQRTASAPGSPNSPASTSPNSSSHQIPQIKLEHTPSFAELTAAASLSPHSSGRRSSVRKVRRTVKEMSQSDDDDERREKVKNSEKKRRDRLRYDPPPRANYKDRS